MSRTIAFALLGLLTAFNLGVLLINASPPSRAAVAGMNARQLVKDPDFTRAVKTVVERCKVNLDLAKLSC
jgi:hypothetical protein